MPNDSYPIEHAPSGMTQREEMVTLDTIMTDLLTNLMAKRDSATGTYAIGRELSLAITHQEDAQVRLRRAIEQLDRQKAGQA